MMTHQGTTLEWQLLINWCNRFLAMAMERQPRNKSFALGLGLIRLSSGLLQQGSGRRRMLNSTLPTTCARRSA